jgi:hypothetical protein
LIQVNGACIGNAASVRCVQCRTNWEIGMVRCLLGVLVLTAGMVALASVARENSPSDQGPTPNRGGRLREMEVTTATGVSRTLFQPLPAVNLGFSLN